MRVFRPGLLPVRLLVKGFLVVFLIATSLPLAAQCADSDGDGACDSVDNCPTRFNPDQSDTDSDGVGNACDNCDDVPNPNQVDSDGNGVGDKCNAFEDQDGDNYADDLDNCPTVYNPDQADADANGVGDACNSFEDMDGDGFADPLDNCPAVSNSSQTDSDEDGLGDRCDNCPDEAQSDQADADADGVGDLCDTCPDFADPEQLDEDGDGQGDLCDPCTDTDGDGSGNPGFPLNTCTTDNCPYDPNNDQSDVDADAVGDVCDNCIDDANTDQFDLDKDGLGDLCDLCIDVDDDGFGDPDFPGNTCPDDNCTYPPNPDQSDVDGDMVGDLCDNCPTDANADQADLDGVGDFGEPQEIVFIQNGILTTVAADLDGDGDLDVIAGGGGLLAWYDNLDGRGHFAALPLRWIDFDPSPDYNSVVAADLDGDGDMDVLSTVGWYKNLDGRGNFGSRRAIWTGCSVESVFVADVDGDEDADVLFACDHSLHGKCGWHENLDGLGDFGPERLISASPRRFVYADDLDADGDEDVISSSDESAIAWYENLDGSGAFGPAQDFGYEVGSTYSVFVFDADGDDDPDVVAASFSGIADISWYENLDGLGSFGPAHVISTEATNARTVFAADLDADGDDDVLSASSGDNKIAWYENLDGLGTFGSQRIIYSPVFNAGEVFAADVDGDGDYDALSASGDDRRVSWYRNGSDGVGDVCDNCIDASNGNQADRDGNGIGDACNDFEDSDGDEFANGLDNCPTVFNSNQWDGDADGVGDACDNCSLDWNPSQVDRDADDEGDDCDLDDGIIHVRFAQPGILEWQEEIGYSTWNSYRGDLGVLKNTGEYTQVVGSNPLAGQICGLGEPFLQDFSIPDPGLAAFFLTTGVTATGVENPLGFDSTGAQRPNSNPCP